MNTQKNFKIAKYSIRVGLEELDWKYNVYGGQTCTCIDLVGIDYTPEPYRTQTRRLFNTHTHRQDVCTASHRPLFFGSPTIVSQFYSIRTRETETEQHWLIHSQAIHDGASRSFDSSESSERTVLRDRSKWLREGLDQWCFWWRALCRYGDSCPE